ncbi:MAG TPA: PQQ-binding-like beta-propeller repeat protein, partial [Gemmatimonadales bacterium]|nr:PQQ-binding-like beta-propeller repeat protein [Gemmatimonadales bacterium]
EVFSSPAVGADGTVYAGSEDRHLYAVNPDGTLKWRQLTTAPIFSHPALGEDGPVFISAGNAVYAFRVADGGLAATPWPKFHHDNRNSGNVLTPLP